MSTVVRRTIRRRLASLGAINAECRRQMGDGGTDRDDQGDLDQHIVQNTRVFHPGADLMARLNARPEFSGRADPDAAYGLVDDVPTNGGTLAELANFRQAGGAWIAGAAVIVNASRTGRLTPEVRITDAIERRYGDVVRELFGIEPAALTADEARYLIGFRNVDALRNRSAKAAEETNRRLRAKGFR